MSVGELIIILQIMGGNPVMTDSIGNWQRFQMADSCIYETLDYGDSTLVIQTICAPVCSSVASVYNREGDRQRAIPYPGKNSIFPYATIRDGVLIWEDRTAEILDSEEINAEGK